ncbi:hypothetical protein SeMB42_g05283 [Synchytrium endobioticum]|uniref:Uncharacterized protein n=1 Tax=Synchytrium endobioticum TaxID=286115 RepID=A0A507CSG4_9FUNG|nr:hypothetical protein SeMB42_g05283 [Synchytrium endobioticum]
MDVSSQGENIQKEQFSTRDSSLNIITMLANILVIVASLASMANAQAITGCGVGANADIACLSKNAQYTLAIRVLETGNMSLPQYDAKLQVLCSYHSVNSPPITAAEILTTGWGEFQNCRSDVTPSNTTLLAWFFVNSTAQTGAAPVYAVQAPCVGSVVLTNTTLRPLSDLVYMQGAADQVRGSNCTLLSPPPSPTAAAAATPTGKVALPTGASSVVLSAAGSRVDGRLTIGHGKDGWLTLEKLCTESLLLEAQAFERL